MFGAVLTAVLLSSGAANPVALAQARYGAIRSYEVTVTSSDARRNQTQVVHYYYRKPGFVRVEFVTPHKGVTLIYRASDNKVWLWPFGFHKFPALHLSPRNSLIVDAHGHTIDRSDVGPLFENLRTLQAKGQTDVLGDERIGDRQAMHVVVTGDAGETVEGVHRYDVWLEQDTGFPVKVISYDIDDQPIETVLMDDVRINVPFPAGFFSP